MTDVSSALIQAAYIVAALLFILSLAGLSKHETARDGNVLGMIGMAIALVATLWLALRDADLFNWVAIIVAMAKSYLRSDSTIARRRSTAMRADQPCAAQAGCACRAHAMARSTVSASAQGKRPINNQWSIGE